MKALHYHNQPVTLMVLAALVTPYPTRRFPLHQPIHQQSPLHMLFHQTKLISRSYILQIFLRAIIIPSTCVQSLINLTTILGPPMPVIYKWIGIDLYSQQLHNYPTMATIQLEDWYLKTDRPAGAPDLKT